MIEIGFVLLGGFLSWLITFFYYQKNKIETIDVQKLMEFQIHATSQGDETYITIPLYRIDEDDDMVLNFCPRCLGINVYKKIHWQSEKGERDDNYIIGCHDCNYHTCQIDINCHGNLTEGQLRYLNRKRKLNALKRGEKGELKRKECLTGIPFQSISGFRAK